MCLYEQSVFELESCCSLCFESVCFTVFNSEKLFHRTTSIKFFFFFCFYFGFLSRTLTNHRTVGEGEGISLSPRYHFHSLHRHLGISKKISAESPPLHISSSQTRTGNLWFPRSSRAHTTSKISCVKARARCETFLSENFMKNSFKGISWKWNTFMKYFYYSN